MNEAVEEEAEAEVEMEAAKGKKKRRAAARAESRPKRKRIQVGEGIWVQLRFLMPKAHYTIVLLVGPNKTSCDSELVSKFSIADDVRFGGGERKRGKGRRGRVCSEGGLSTPTSGECEIL